MCIYPYIYIYIYICIHTYIYIRTYIYKYIMHWCVQKFLWLFLTLICLSIIYCYCCYEQLLFLLFLVLILLIPCSIRSWWWAVAVFSVAQRGRVFQHTLQHLYMCEKSLNAVVHPPFLQILGSKFRKMPRDSSTLLLPPVGCFPSRPQTCLADQGAISKIWHVKIYCVWSPHFQTNIYWGYLTGKWS